MAEATDRPQRPSVDSKHLEDVCQCSVCLERYSDPKLLPCGHCFCKGCLEDMLVIPCKCKEGWVYLVYFDEIQKITCPNCRAEHKLDTGLSWLPGNIYLVQVLDVLDSSSPRIDEKHNFETCSFCPEQYQEDSLQNEIHATSRRATHKCFTCNKIYCTNCVEREHPKQNTLDGIPHFVSLRKRLAHDNLKYYCIKHNSILKYFCGNCNILCCIDCIIHDHKRHPMCTIRHAAANVQHNIQQASQEIQATLEATQAARDACYTSINVVNEIEEKTISKIRLKKNLILAQVRQVLDLAEVELVKQHRGAKGIFMEKVSKDIERLGHFQGTVRTTENFLKDMNNISDQTDLLIEGSNLLRLLQEQSKLPQEQFSSESLSFSKYVGQDISKSSQSRLCLELLEAMGILQTPSSIALAEVFAPSFLRLFQPNDKVVQDILQEMNNVDPPSGTYCSPCQSCETSKTRVSATMSMDVDRSQPKDQSIENNPIQGPYEAVRPTEDCYDEAVTNATCHWVSDVSTSTTTTTESCSEVNQEPMESADDQDIDEKIVVESQKQVDNESEVGAASCSTSDVKDVLTVGSAVLVRENTGEYSTGEVKAVENMKCSVLLHGLGKIVECCIDDPTSVVIKNTCSQSKLMKGTRVIFCRENRYFPGTLQKMKKDSWAGLKKWRVLCDDGGTFLVRPEDTIPMPKSDKSVLPGIGCYVYAKMPQCPSKYEKAIVMEKTKEGLTVRTLLSGLRLQFKTEDVDTVIYNEEPSVSELELGNSVIMDKEGNRDTALKMSRGRITEINLSARDAPMYKVSFDDKKTKLASTEQLRLLPECIEEKSKTL